MAMGCGWVMVRGGVEGERWESYSSKSRMR
jgi:hypothetical protein